ncbi:MAG: hypothetical protein Q8J68_06195 [Methanolobus sp.]|uniref:hypothetical protein n=1 Tax=Methanolobus sp. TaxID=1874737 RepID=UPI00273101BB|nr:hypothetical protein [Methanolobus sp.]MDP2216861.1 hypothetical protein [Methanolobus sp.]
MNQSPVVPESNVSSIIGALDNGEIDLWACPETAGRYFTEQATGWEEYVYMNPVQANLYYKTTYYRLVTGKPDRQQL